MRKLVFTFMVMAALSMAVSAQANPFIVCDPQAGVSTYKVTGASWVTSPVVAQPDGSIHMDISTAPVGTSNLNFSACWVDPVWGELCSVTVPFSFTRPGAPVTPKAVKLAP
jgi:hypothetical protein